MRLIKKVYYKDDDYCGVYKCDKCHAYIFDKILISYDINDPEVCEPKCAFCDPDALLSQQYWMALCTVVWTCQPDGDCVDAAPAFPSFKYVTADQGSVTDSSLCFTFRGIYIDAHVNSVRPCTHSKQFRSILDDNCNDFDPRFLAQAVVDLCRHDLRARNNRKEAE
ncbi:hypothetical protein [Bombiscardovia coagulans]|uniref:Uncharacterized protein n=1 Tax=Bombiscardovia coagulans TaxID=686666 RepID=A0A261ESN7_9BIFI|nr:hypothetical protein [Bombiscardovia coagulans]OZG49880.1 hypothetical protein BOCO_0397 [Bombiscardovia coagulans]